MEGFGRRLENLREKFGYSKRDVSHRLGYTANVYGSYEREERRPTLETMIKLAEIYDVSLDYLIRGEENHQKSKDISKEEELQEVLRYFRNNGIEEPYILQRGKWSILSYEDLIELEDHFEWIVHKAKERSK
ncbi:helix-turn-helix domain-containing protein [Virgibacillus sp. CBA3643]|uniref:helix-turn-helix domain-containing protein n=1 Tax=Virgibacillus sp. CBA3643 TaxID=2942278 RepID=UPI0035A2D1AE